MQNGRRGCRGFKPGDHPGVVPARIRHMRDQTREETRCSTGESMVKKETCKADLR